HQDVLDSALPRRPRDVDDVLGPDDGIIVRVRDRRRALRDREVDDIVRRVATQPSLVELCLRDVPVLAELAAEVAARRAEAENRRAREEVVQRLFLDRIYREPGRTPVAELHEATAVVLADVTEAGLSVGHAAVARAERAEDSIVRLFLPPARGRRVSTVFGR